MYYKREVWLRINLKQAIRNAGSICTRDSIQVANGSSLLMFVCQFLIFKTTKLCEFEMKMSLSWVVVVYNQMSFPTKWQ
jgi:hypothetical protein